MKLDKKLVLSTVPYVVIFIITLQVIPQVTALFPDQLPIDDRLIALLASIIIKIVVYVKGKNAKSTAKVWSMARRVGVHNSKCNQNFIDTKEVTP